MSDKKSYTDVLREIEGRLSGIETATQYQETHLRNINGNLEKQNLRIGNCEITGAKNRTGIKLIYKIGGSILGVVALFVALALGVLNLFD